MVSDVHLGYEVGSGLPVAIPIRHLAVTGQTQLSGKTTTLEALVERSGMGAIAFVTKRFENSFAYANRLQPYFRERADWQFVASVLEATMREKMRFERAWIIRAAKGARSLADVQHNVRRLMDKAKGMSSDVYLTLDNYLDIVIPQIETLPYQKDHEFDIPAGLNVMDLSAYSMELQSLVIRSVIEWIYETASNTLTIIPEAWEFIPQNRGSPVLLSCEQLIRKGGAGKNFVWLDSQDIAGVHKNILRSVGVWVLGVQREANEIKRMLAHIPAPKPKVEDVMSLERGQFYVCFDRLVKKVYVQPAWASSDKARAVARGEAALVQPLIEKIARDVFMEEGVTPKEAEQLRTDNARLQKDNHDLRNRLAALEASLATPVPNIVVTKTRPVTPLVEPQVNMVADELYQEIRRRLLDEDEGLVLNLINAVPEIMVTKTRKVIDIDGATPRGRIVGLVATGFFDSGVTQGGVRSELRRTGSDVNPGRISEVVNGLVADGFLTREGSGFKAVPGMKINIRELSEAA